MVNVQMTCHLELIICNTVNVKIPKCNYFERKARVCFLNLVIVIDLTNTSVIEGRTLFCNDVMHMEI